MTGPLSATLDLADVEAALQILTAAFPAWAPPVDDRFLVVWWERLRGFDPDDILAAARQCERGDRFPTLEAVAQAAGATLRRRREAIPALTEGSPGTIRPDLGQLKAELREQITVEAARGAGGRVRNAGAALRQHQARKAS